VFRSSGVAGSVGSRRNLPDTEAAMTEVPGTDRDQARENVLHETPLVPDSVEDSDDDPRYTDMPVNRGDEGVTGQSVKPPARSTDLGTDPDRDERTPRS
jgi:hypothetical protein